MTIRRAPPCALVLALALALPPAEAAAADPPARKGAAEAADREAARTLAQQGFDAFDAGAWERAVDLFRKADARYHAPTHWLYIARAEDKLGKLLDAAASYERVLADVLAPSAPDAFRDAQGAARNELEALRARIPTLAVELTGAPEGSAPEITVDGEQVAPGQAVPLDPGRHVVRVAARGAPAVERAVELAERDARRVPIALGAPAPQEPPSIVPAVALIGAGAAGVGLGIITGVLSIGKVGELEGRCPDKHCNTTDAPIADDARALGTASTIGFIAGGLLAGAGVVLIVLRAPAGPAQSGAGPTLTAGAGPASFALRGAF